MLTLRSKVLRKLLNIDVTEGLKAKALRLSVLETSDKLAVRMEGPRTNISVLYVAVPLLAMQQIANCKERVSEGDESIKKALMTRGAAKVMEPSMSTCCA